MPVNSFENYHLSWKPDKDKMTKPYFEYLAKDLEDKIRTGKIRPGTKLPPQREVADYLDINFGTITRVYDLCRQKGLIYGITGKGTFVTHNAMQNITITGANLGEDCIELGYVDGFSNYSPLLEKRLSRVVKRGYLHTLYDHSKPLGQPHQLARRQMWLNETGVDADINHISILSGAQNALAVVCTALFSRGDRIACDMYTYSNFIELAKMLSISLVPVSCDEKGMQPQRLDIRCKQNKISGIYLMPDYSNPTTITIPLERRQELCRVIKKHGLILIEDDLSPWLNAEQGTIITPMYNLLDSDSIYIQAISKNMCPGLRISYMAYGEKYREKLVNGIFNINVKTSALDVELITELLLSGDGYNMLMGKYKLAQLSGRIYEKYFPQHYNKQLGYFQWLPINTTKDAETLERELAELGVRAYHSKRFSTVQNEEHSFLRVSLCSTKNLKSLEKGLKILKSYVDSL